MAYIRAKYKKGNPYYYIVEGRRTDGKVKQVVLEYIGPLEKLEQLALSGYLFKKTQKEACQNSAGKTSSSADVILDALESADLSFKAYEHGAVMAMLWTAQQLGIEEILDESFSHKTIKGIPRSRLLLLAMLHRAIEPGSKREFTNWCCETSLPYYLQFDARELDSAAFWEAMDGISEDEIITAWNRIIQKLIELTGIDLLRFHLDYSNYFTFINTTNGRCVICKRGHNKQKRDDLLQFSLAALTSSGLNVPLVWQLYDGNINDKTEFPAFTAHIQKQLISLGIDPGDVTISFDSGSNSEENFSNLGFHFVCAYSMVGHKELYDIDLNLYGQVPLQNGHERQAYFLPALDFSGIHGAGVLTFSQALYDGQMAQLERDLKAIQENVEEARRRLANKRSSFYTQLKKRDESVRHARRDAEEYNARLDEEEKQQKESGTKKRGHAKKRKPLPEWNAGQEMLQIVHAMIYAKHKYFAEFSSISLGKNSDGTYDLTWEINEEAEKAYVDKFYGKKLIATDHTDWSMADILNEYSDQECIENGIFRTSKDVDHFAIRPQYHWTDQKIRVHVFLCLTAITIAEVMRTHFENQGISHTKAALLDRLNEVHEGWVFLDDMKVKRSLEKLDEEHLKLWHITETINSGLKPKSRIIRTQNIQQM